MSQNTRVKFLDVLDGLNTEQRRAVELTEGAVQIVAGPGTGKTKTLSCRIAYMLNQGISPQQIVALTFTKKAAEEMRARVAALIKDAELPLPAITTFHGLCYELLEDKDLALISTTHGRYCRTRIL